MRTKEAQEHQSDDINELYREVSRKISEVRRASRLSHCELAAKLGIPIWYSEILENGILVPTDDKRYRRWSSCLFTKEELLRISRQLSSGIVPSSRVQPLDSETVFFCPVTINSSAVFAELRSLARIHAFELCLPQVVSGFSLKYRLLYRQVYAKSGRRNAELMRQRLLSFLGDSRVRL